MKRYFQEDQNIVNGTMVAPISEAMGTFIRAPLTVQYRYVPFRTRATCTSSSPHKPVLVRELLSYLPAQTKRVIDCTVGAGGHAKHILRSHAIETYIGIDKDPVALRYAEQALPSPPVQLIHGDFRDVGSLVSNDIGADAVILDAGVSSMQLDNAKRGFSFTRDGPLDMRMERVGRSAADLVNYENEEELARVIYEYGEERGSRRIARAIVEARGKGWIGSTGELASVVAKAKGWRRKGVHPATQTFQALRIAVNDELEALAMGIRGGIGLLRSGGRMMVISFHSLEDRVTKRIFRELSEEVGGVRLLTKRPIVCGEDEVRENVRSRSAKLRVVERVREGEVGAVRKVNKYKNRKSGTQFLTSNDLDCRRAVAMSASLRATQSTMLSRQ